MASKKNTIGGSYYWDANNINILESSTIHLWLNNTMINYYDADIRNIIKQVKIPYRKNGGNGSNALGNNGLECKVFSLSGYEVNYTSNNSSLFPLDGAKLSYFNNSNNKRVAYVQGTSTPAIWWLRSPGVGTTNSVLNISTNGGWSADDANSSFQVRPAIIMPLTLVNDSNNVIVFPNVNNLTAPSISMQQQPIPLSWSLVSLPGFEVTYQLQRNVDNSGWTTIYTGSDTSYTDTAGTWTQVQYQVAAVVEGGIGDYTQSVIVPVSDPNALVISGQDSNLGILTSNLPYTVSSNTGNPISLTRSVNGVPVATISINSGFAYNIPITDLPTGANTVSITAQVQSPSGQVNATRTWTYYKDPINIPDSGGVAQLTQNGTNIWPISLAECIKVPTYFGNTLDKALELLTPAVNPTIIAAGTYTGTGQYGSSTPNILNFSTQPLLVLVYGPNTSLSITTTNSSSPAYITGTQAKWYSNISAEEQLNSSGVEYSYIAIVKT